MDSEQNTCQSRSCLRPSAVAFSGAQVHTVVDKEEPEMMLDSGSTVTLGKDKSLFTSINDLERNTRMNTNGGSKNIDQEGCWRGYCHAY